MAWIGDGEGHLLGLQPAWISALHQLRWGPLGRTVEEGDPMRLCRPRAAGPSLFHILWPSANAAFHSLIFRIDYAYFLSSQFITLLIVCPLQWNFCLEVSTSFWLIRWQCSSADGAEAYLRALSNRISTACKSLGGLVFCACSCRRCWMARFQHPPFSSAPCRCVELCPS
jgi:hypothetical protein